MRRCARPLMAGAALLVVLVGSPALGSAAEERRLCPICSTANAETASYPSKVTSTLIRGATNACLGWTELLQQPAQEARAGRNAFIGIVQGLGQSVGRTLAGAGEVLTFWTPKVQNRYVHFATDCPLCMGGK